MQYSTEQKISKEEEEASETEDEAEEKAGLLASGAGKSDAEGRESV